MIIFLSTILCISHETDLCHLEVWCTCVFRTAQLNLSQICSRVWPSHEQQYGSTRRTCIVLQQLRENLKCLTCLVVENCMVQCLRDVTRTVPAACNRPASASLRIQAGPLARPKRKGLVTFSEVSATFVPSSVQTRDLQVVKSRTCAPVRPRKPLLLLWWLLSGPCRH